MSNAQITLPADLDLSAAADLKRLLVESLDGNQELLVDASETQRVTSPCLQVLVAAVHQGARIIATSPAFSETAKSLGLVAALGLQEEVDV